MPVLSRRQDQRGDAPDQLQRREDERGVPVRAGLGERVDQPLGVELLQPFGGEARSGAVALEGVDSDLPTFRGDQGFWTAYPAYRGHSLADVACPYTFTRDPELAWGFYGHRLNLYRQHPPHAGFTILRRWAETMPHGYFVLTSNVDGYFQQAGFDPERIYECHGSIHHLQCHAGCPETWPADDVTVERGRGSTRCSNRAGCVTCRRND